MPCKSAPRSVEIRRDPSRSVEIRRDPSKIRKRCKIRKILIIRQKPSRSVKVRQSPLNNRPSPSLSAAGPSKTVKNRQKPSFFIEIRDFECTLKIAYLDGNQHFRHQSVAMACPPAQPSLALGGFVCANVLYKVSFVTFITIHQEQSIKCTLQIMQKTVQMGPLGNNQWPWRAPQPNPSSPKLGLWVLMCSTRPSLSVWSQHIRKHH